MRRKIRKKTKLIILLAIYLILIFGSDLFFTLTINNEMNKFIIVYCTIMSWISILGFIFFITKMSLFTKDYIREFIYNLEILEEHSLNKIDIEKELIKSFSYILSQCSDIYTLDLEKRNEDEKKLEYGIRFIKAQDNEIYVERIFKSTRAYEQGIELGDRLISVNGDKINRRYA